MCLLFIKSTYLQNIHSPNPYHIKVYVYKALCAHQLHTFLLLSMSMLRLRLCLGILLFLLFQTACGEWVIDTDDEENSGNKLAHIAQHMSNHTLSGVSIVVRGSQPLVLLDKVEFFNVSNVLLTATDVTVVKCSILPLGIAFINSSNISIRGLNMSGCGYYWKNYRTSLLFYNCHDVVLHNVYVNDSWGVAVLFWDTRGSIVIKNVTIYDACQNTPKDGACWTCINITNCYISENSAYWGGGMFIFQTKPTMNNFISISHSVFSENAAIVSGGGAMIGFLYPGANISHLNTNVTFYNCSFMSNNARFGAGTGVFSTHMMSFNSEASVQFLRCIWKGNTAWFSNDVDLAPARADRSSSGYLPIVKFIDVQFLSNKRRISSSPTVNYNSYGSFGTTLFSVHFGGTVLFKHLKDTALHMSSSTVTFLPGSQVTFANNKGTSGAALAMYGFSVLQLDDNCSVKFIQNETSVFGGAIYFETSDKHEFQSTTKCFLDYGGNTVNTSERNISVMFINNQAEIAGHSIYALSLLSCYFEWTASHENLSVLTINSSIFENIGDFIFVPEHRSIATSGVHFINASNLMGIIPGRCFQLGTKIEDELGHVYEQDFHLTVIQGNVSFARHYLNHNICLSGTPLEEAVIQVTTVDFQKRSHNINVTMSPCPPGFYHDVEERVCKCGAETTKHSYVGITQCYMTMFQAAIEPHYWGGYVNKKLLTATCPLGFCKNVQTLPISTSPEEINRVMCGDKRRGILCGQCENNLSVYYHSPRFTCGKSDNCSLGFLFYLFSEILPLLFLLTVIVFFDIQLTFGIANTLTLFAQLLNVISINGRGILVFPTSLERIADTYRVIYGLLNLDFFSIEPLSFCLWEGATVLDMLAVRYIAIVIAVIFVLLLVLFLRYCQCTKVCVVKKRVSSKNSVIHGLAAILILSYSQCTKVSFELLTYTTLYGEGQSESLGVTFYGGIEYLKREHYAYAIPACLCLALVVTLSPLLLLIYPLHLKLVARCKASKISRFMSRASLINKLRPILDSFQGTFKDDFRFFAGLYFLYRIAILSATAFTMNTLQAHLIMEIILIVIIGVHATVRPYQKPVHNVLDMFILVNMALINSLSLFAYVLESYSDNTDHETTSIICLQFVLIIIPLIALTIYYGLRPIVANLRVHVCTKKNEESDAEDDTGMEGFDNAIDHERLPYREF